MSSTILAQLNAAGFKVEHLEIGKIVRCETEARPGKKNGWYICHEITLDSGKTIYAGAYQDYTIHPEHLKFNVNLPEFNAAEQARYKETMERQRRAFAAQKKKLGLEVSKKAESFIASLSVCKTSNYLQKKQIDSFSVYQDAKGNTIIPYHDFDQKIWAYQCISEKGKWNLPKNCNVEKKFFIIGQSPLEGEKILLCEGYSTGASLHMASKQIVGKGFTVFVTFSCSNLEKVAKDVAKRYPSNDLIICADDDHKTKNNPGLTTAQRVAKKLNAKVCVPKFKDRKDGQTDFNDLHCDEGLSAVVHLLREVDFDENWQSKLKRHISTGEINDLAYNIRLILGNDESWRGVLGFCELSYRIVKMRLPPYSQGKLGEFEDLDEYSICSWLTENYDMRPRSREVNKAIELVANDNAFHPVKDYLNSLRWDGEHRLSSWVHKIFGVEDNEYHALVGRFWLIGAVARVMRFPESTKFENVLILEGKQGLKKSTFLRMLGGEWFADANFVLGEKEAYINMQGVWIIELSELDSLNKAESTKAKFFFSQEKDRFRKPYASYAKSYPRQVVFAGSTNQQEYLKDYSGNRRYWPVHCQYVDMDYATEVRDQLFAEAVEAFKNGERWYPDEQQEVLFIREQDKRQQVDTWEDLILEYFENNPRETELTAGFIFENILHFAPKDVTRGAETRLGLVMSKIGCTKVRKRVGKRLRYYYALPEDFFRVEEVG